MTAQERFKQLLDEHVWPLLRDHGCLRRAGTFWLRQGDYWGVINFQKSSYSTSDTVRFTVNLAIAAEHLREFTPFWKPASRPAAAECSIRHRLGFVLPGRPHRDWWWIVDRVTDIERLGFDFRGHLEFSALPWLRERLSDRGLCDKLLEDLEADSYFWRYDLLEELIRRVGPRDRMADVQRARQRPTAWPVPDEPVDWSAIEAISFDIYTPPR